MWGRDQKFRFPPHTSHLFSRVQGLHSYKQSIHLKVLISSTCVPREISQICVTFDTSFQHPFPTCPCEYWILSDLPRLPTHLWHLNLVYVYTYACLILPCFPSCLLPPHPPCCCLALTPSVTWAHSILTPQLSNFATTGIKFSCLVVSTWS